MTVFGPCVLVFRQGFILSFTAFGCKDSDRFFPRFKELLCTRNIHLCILMMTLRMFGLTRCFKYNGSDTLIYSRELTRKPTIHPDELEQCKEVFSRVVKQFESLIDADTIQVHQTKLNNAIEAYKVYRG